MGDTKLSCKYTPFFMLSWQQDYFELPKLTTHMSCYDVYTVSHISYLQRSRVDREYHDISLMTVFLIWFVQCSSRKMLEKFIGLKSVTVAWRFTVENMDILRPLQILCGNDVRSFKNAGRWAIDPDLGFFVFVTQMVPESSTLLRNTLRGFRELSVPSWELYFQRIWKILREKLRIFLYKISFLQQLLPEEYPRR